MSWGPASAGSSCAEIPTPAIAACTDIAAADVTDRADRTRGEESLRLISGFALIRRAPPAAS
jgi:hypothetical protein